jgi:hypothetical protein
MTANYWSRRPTIYDIAGAWGLDIVGDAATGAPMVVQKSMTVRPGNGANMVSLSDFVAACRAQGIPVQDPGNGYAPLPVAGNPPGQMVLPAGGAGLTARRQTLPITPQTIAPGATIDIAVRPQRPFRVERLVLVVPAATFTLLDLRVGATPQFVAAGGIPAECFAPTAFGVSFRGDSAVPGVDVTLQIQNTTGAPAVIGGMIQGEALD